MFNPKWVRRLALLGASSICCEDSSALDGGQREGSPLALSPSCNSDVHLVSKDLGYSDWGEAGNGLQLSP